MANPMWIAGGKSPNPGGRGKMKNSARTVKGMVERFIKRNITPRKLQALYDGLTALQKLDLLSQLLPYILPKVQAESMSDAEIDLFYQKLEQTIKDVQQRKAG